MMHLSRAAGRLPLGTSNVLWMAVSLASLLVIVYYTYLHQSTPQPAFALDPYDWTVFALECEGRPDCPEVGDRVLAIGGVSLEQHLGGYDSPAFEAMRSHGETVPIRVQRGDDALTIEIGLERVSTFDAGVALISLVFWLAGSIAFLLLRPRGEAWGVLVLFNYATALWVGSGSLAGWNAAGSVVTYHAALALFAPLALHLHLVLPNPVAPRFKRWILSLAYPTAVALFLHQELPRLTAHLAPALASFVPWATPTTRLLPKLALFAIAGSLVLLTLRVFRADASNRVLNRVMLSGVSFGVGPVVTVILIALIAPETVIGNPGASALLGAICVVAIPIWPMTYLFALHRHKGGPLEFRANRLLGVHGFLSIYMTAFVLAYVTARAWWPWKNDELSLGLVISLSFTMLAILLYGPFQRLLDHRVFDVRYRPSELVTRFAERIPTASNREGLNRLLREEILPILMIRQSGLYLLGDDPEPDVVYEHGVPGTPAVVQLRQMLTMNGRLLSATEADPDWVRVAVPLSIEDRQIGLWMLGERDPDDSYSRSDIELLTALANQVAPVIENLRLVETTRRELLEKQELQQQLLHSQKMEALGRLSASIAHDFNNLLSVIVGYSSLLLADSPDEETRQKIASIATAADQGSKLTRQLLAFTRRQESGVVITDVNKTVADFQEMLERLAGEQIQVKTVLGPDVPHVRIDPGRLSQVVMNLAVNAIDAMAEGGVLTLTTSSFQCNPGHAGHRGLPPGHYALLTIQDTGIGIDPDMQSRIFEPFVTTKDKGKGTGLGLSTVFGIVQQSGGQIFLDSKERRGSVFSIYLPACKPAAAIQDKGHSVDESRLRDETVLIVEDERQVRTVTADILRSRGYTVIEAEDGPEALEEFERCGDRVDLVLTDVRMPRMKGPELVRRLRDLQPGLKVVYMTGYYDHDDEILADRFDEPDTGLVRKPFRPHELETKLSEILDPTP